MSKIGTTKKKKSKPRKAVGKRNAKTAPRPEGRPPLYSDPIILQAKIDEYFATGMSKREVVTDAGVSYIPTATITGLCLFLGFCDRQSFLDYERKPEFSRTLKMARSRIEERYEVRLSGNTCTGAIFALKNFGWVDKVEVAGNGLQRTVVNVISNHTPPPEKKADEQPSPASRQDSQPLLHPQADDSADDA